MNPKASNTDLKLVALTAFTIFLIWAVTAIFLSCVSHRPPRLQA